MEIHALRVGHHPPLLRQRRRASTFAYFYGQRESSYSIGPNVAIFPAYRARESICGTRADANTYSSAGMANAWKSPVMKPLICVLVLALSGCASTMTGHALNIAVIGAASADYVTTQQGLARGAREANPLLGQGAVRQAVVKAVGVTGVIALAGLVDLKGRPVLAHVVRGIAIALWSGAAIWNARQR